MLTTNLNIGIDKIKSYISSLTVERTASYTVRSNEKDIKEKLYNLSKK